MSTKPAISPLEVVQDIGPRLLWRTNRKSHTRFQLVPKSMTLNSRNALLQKKSFYDLPVPTTKMWRKVDPYYQWQNVGQWLQCIRSFLKRHALYKFAFCLLTHLLSF